MRNVSRVRQVMTCITWLVDQGRRTPLVLAILAGALVTYLALPLINQLTTVQFTSSSSSSSSSSTEYKGPRVNGIPFYHSTTPPTPEPTRPLHPAVSRVNVTQSYDITSLTDDLTIITAYFDLGEFEKGDRNHSTVFTPKLYHDWMRVFAKIDNPVIAYFEKEEDMEYFKMIRGKLPETHTKIHQISRSKLWSFGLLAKIREIYNKEGYPKYHPGTVVPEYSCAMHAKYELVHQSVIDNPFRTKYFAWVDIGQFRMLWEGSGPTGLHLLPPPGLDESKVAYPEVFNRSEKIPAKQIFILNQEWVGGGLFVGRADTLLKWTAQYINATETYIGLEFMNTDQQVVYAMMNEGHKYPSQLQAYPKPPHGEPWFHLGFSCIAEGAKHLGTATVPPGFFGSYRMPVVKSAENNMSHLSQDRPQTIGSLNVSMTSGSTQGKIPLQPPERISSKKISNIDISVPVNPNLQPNKIHKETYNAVVDKRLSKSSQVHSHPLDAATGHDISTEQGSRMKESNAADGHKNDRTVPETINPAHVPRERVITKEPSNTVQEPIDSNSVIKTMNTFAKGVSGEANQQDRDHRNINVAADGSNQ